MDQNQMKKAVAEAAIAYVPDGSIVGVGTGSTANFFIDALVGIQSLNQAEPGRTNIHLFRWCLQECPRGLGAHEFVDRFVTIFPLCPPKKNEGIPSKTFPFKLVQTKHASALEAYFRKKMTCRFCPLEGAQPEIVDLFLRRFDVYASMKHHLSEVRIRQGVYEHLAFALVRGIVGQLFLNFIAAKRREGMTEDAIFAAFTDKFEWVVSVCWDAMAKLDYKA